jgi:hypothetical protein
MAFNVMSRLFQGSAGADIRRYPLNDQTRRYRMPLAVLPAIRCRG